MDTALVHGLLGGRGRRRRVVLPDGHGVPVGDDDDVRLDNGLLVVGVVVHMAVDVEGEGLLGEEGGHDSQELLVVEHVDFGFRDVCLVMARSTILR